MLLLRLPPPLQPSNASPLRPPPTFAPPPPPESKASPPPWARAPESNTSPPASPVEIHFKPHSGTSPVGVPLRQPRASSSSGYKTTIPAARSSPIHRRPRHHPTGRPISSTASDDFNKILEPTSSSTTTGARGHHHKPDPEDSANHQGLQASIVLHSIMDAETASAVGSECKIPSWSSSMEEDCRITLLASVRRAGAARFRTWREGRITDCLGAISWLSDSGVEFLTQDHIFIIGLWSGQS